MIRPNNDDSNERSSRVLSNGDREAKRAEDELKQYKNDVLDDSRAVQVDCWSETGFFGGSYVMCRLSHDGQTIQEGQNIEALKRTIDLIAREGWG